jgi:hypothetical protein
VLDDVDAADWFGYDEVERRCRNEYWWPLLERVVAAVARA